MPTIVKVLALALLAALGACATVTPTATNARDWLIQYRTGHGLSAVSLDGRLTAFAQDQANAMAFHDVLSHDVGGSFRSRVERAGLGDGRIAENVAYGSQTEKAVMEQWKASSAHNDNLLMPKATRFGIASARSNGPKPKTYWAMAIAADPPKPIPVLPSEGPAVPRSVAVGESAAPPFASLFGQ